MSATPTKTEMQITLTPATSPNPLYTFKMLIKHQGNALAIAAAKKITTLNRPDKNPLVFYGDAVGIGKTHLLHAIWHSGLRTNLGHQIRYISLADFLAEFVLALQENTIAKFTAYYQSLDLLLIDDADLMMGKMHTQEMLLKILDARLMANKPTVITYKQSPEALENIDPCLQSRMLGGLTIRLAAPDIDARIRIMQQYVTYHDLELTEADAQRIVIAKGWSDIRKLLGALNDVIFYARFIDAPISESLITEVLSNPTSPISTP